MAGRDITSANSVIMLSVVDLYNTPIQLQGYAAEDVFDSDPVDAIETSMGIDGKMSAGFIYMPVEWSVVLQANSDSNDIFDNWYAAEKAKKGPIFCNATVLIPSLQRKWAMSNGVLAKFPQIPPSKKTMQPRKFTLRFEDISPAPI